MVATETIKKKQYFGTIVNQFERISLPDESRCAQVQKKSILESERNQLDYPKGFDV